MSQQETVIKVARAYANVTGIRTIVIDETGSPLGQLADETCTSFCQLVQENAARKSECQSIYLYGSYQAERFKEAYVFSCPVGLIHWIAPVLNENRIQYSLVAGPVLISKAEDVSMKEVFQAESKSVPYIKPSQVNDLATLLTTSAFYLSNSDGLLEEEDYYSRQALFDEVIQELKQNKPVLDNYSFEKESELIAKIRLGDQNGTHEILNEILQKSFFTNDNELESMRSRVIDFVVLLFRAVQEGGVDDFIIFGRNYQYIREITTFKTVAEIAYWLSLVIARFNDCVFNLKSIKSIDVMYKVLNYLWEHYMEDITLEKLAKMVYLSPSYLSKLFKEKMKSTFRNYLNTLRVENSKKLLLDATIPLAAVAGMAGFQDQSYYTKVFKKISKMSPGEFRKARGNLASGLFHNSILFSGQSFDLINQENSTGTKKIPIAAPASLNIAVFTAPGATSEICVKATVDIFKVNGIKVRTITTAEVAEVNEVGGLSNLDVIILPGGGGTAEANALGENGCAAVKQFVKNGGGYIGISAGGFLAAVGYNTPTSWLDLVNAEIVDVTHWKRGEGDPQVKITNSTHPILRGLPETFTASYSNGPLFRPGNNPNLPPYQELVVYVDDICDSGETSPGIMPGTSALITSTYGAGKCVLFSFDPELTSGLEGLLIQAVRWVKGLE